MANFQLKFKHKEQVADGTWSFYFEKPTGFVFEAGQYVALVLPRLVAADTRGPVRSLSICSAPFEEDLAFTMRISESGFKQSIMALERGEVAQATQPVGHFTLSHASNGKPIVFIAGGIGITPVRSILKQAEYEQLGRVLVLFSSNRLKKDAAFQEECERLQLRQYQLISTFSQETTVSTGATDERGYISEAMLRKYLPLEQISESWYYLVGAPAFIAAMEKMLREMGIISEHLVSDPFTGMLAASQQRR